MLYEVDDGSAQYWASAKNEDEAKKLVLELPDYETTEDNMSVKEVKGNKALTFHFEGRAIALSADDWAAIYYGVPSCVLACSEW